MSLKESSVRIGKLLRQEYVLEQLQAKGKQEVLAELAGALTRGTVTVDSGAMIRVLREREKLGSTGIGRGVAIPHGKLPGLGEIMIAFGRSREGVEFDALDGKPAHLFFLLMAPEHSASEHLKVLAKVSRMLKDAQFRKRLLEARTREDLLQAIFEKDGEV